MVSKEQYDEIEESNSFIANIRRNLNVVTINEYMQFILAGFAVLLLSGLIYVLAQTPEIFRTDSQGTKLIYYLLPPQGGQFNMGAINEEFVMEMFIVAALISMGVVGLYLMKAATSYVDSQSKALEVLIIGSTLFILAVLLLFFVYLYKLSGVFPSFAGLP